MAGHRWFAPAAFVLFVVIACGGSNGSTRSRDVEDGYAADEEQRDALADTPIVAPGQHEICDEYLQCVAKTSPQTLGVVSSTYGESGTCWTQFSDTTTCSTACLAGLKQARQAFPDETACPSCFVASDCTQLGLASCDPERRVCVPLGCAHDACLLTGTSVRAFGFAAKREDGRIGLIGGDSPTPAETFDPGTGTVTKDAIAGFVATSFAALAQASSKSYVIVGGASGLRPRLDTGRVFFDLAEGTGWADKVQSIDLEAGDVTTIDVPGVLGAVSWPLNDGVTALFGGVRNEGSSPAASKDGILCSLATFPDVTCDSYPDVLNGPRFGHAGICLEASGTIPFSCDRFLVMGGNLPGDEATFGDLMVVERSRSGNYSIKPVPLAAPASDDPIRNEFGAIPFLVDGTTLYSVGGAAFRSEGLAFDAPSIGVHRYGIDETAQTIEPELQPIIDLPENGENLLHRVFHQVVAFDDAKGTVVLVIGGLDRELLATASVLVLRPQAGGLKFVKEFSMNQERLGHSAVVIERPDAPPAVLVVGGFKVENGLLVHAEGAELIPDLPEAW